MRSTCLVKSLGAAAAAVGAASSAQTPCFSGECTYDLPPTSQNMGASLRVWGSEHAISDITEAGGWYIMGCSSDEAEQTIRLVCSSADTNGAGCDHVHKGSTAGTLVRLPENCGPAPFAYVTEATEAKDQSVPATLLQKIAPDARGQAPKVHEFKISTNFTQVSSLIADPVYFSVTGTSYSIGNAVNNTTARRASRHFGRNTQLERRGFWDKITSIFHNVADSINHVDKDFSTTFDPIVIDKDFTLVDASIDCGDLGRLSAKVDAHPQVNAQVTLGLVVEGTLIPPKISDFAVTTALNADLKADLVIAASAAGGPLDTGDLTLFEAPFGAFDIPGILSVGPTFKINTRAKFDLELDVDLAVGLDYHVDNLVFVFPQHPDLPSKGSVNPLDSPLSISVSPEISAKGSLSAHLIPRIDIGLSAFAGAASATVFADVDASASAALTFDFAPTFSTAVGGNAARPTDAAGADSGPWTNTKPAGCVDIGAGVDVNVGVQGSFFGLFDPSMVWPVFSRDFDLFSRCLNGAARAPAGKTARALLPSPAHRRAENAARLAGLLAPRATFALQCPFGTTAAPAPPVQVVSETVPGSDITVSKA